jgi:hypothetical protein
MDRGLSDRGRGGRDGERGRWEDGKMKVKG